MAFTLDISIGSADQSAGAGTFDIIMGDAAPTPGSRLTFDLPETTVTSVLLALIVHSGAIAKGESAETWTLDERADGIGAGNYKLSIFKRTSDRTVGALSGNQILFFAPDEQEIAGCIVQVFGALESTVIEQVSTGAFLSDSNPTFPTIEAGRSKNIVLGVAIADGVLTFEPNGDLEEEELYSSSEIVPSKTFGVYKRVAGAVGEIEVGAVTASSACTGRTWSISLRYEFRGSSHAARIHPANVTNPSRHARRT